MFIQTKGARIYATSSGSKSMPTILGIGGWIGNWELWVEPFSILSQHWHTIAYDHRGAGITVAPVETITLDHLVDDVFAVLDAYGVERCVLAAESAGALTALIAALRNPQRITGLVIADGGYYSAETPDTSPFMAGLRTTYDATLKRFIDACVPEPDSDHFKQWGLKILHRASQEAAIALYAVGMIDLRNEFHRIMQPTLILHGEYDVIVPVKAAQWLANTLPNSRLTIIKGAGHVPAVTRPIDVAREIMDFFAP